MATDIEGWENIVLDREYADGRHENISIVRTDTLVRDNGSPFFHYATHF